MKMVIFLTRTVPLSDYIKHLHKVVKYCIMKCFFIIF